MRVKFGRRIYECSLVTHSADNTLLLLTNNNGVYMVNCLTVETATSLYDKIFRDGWIDVSEYEYSNY